MSIYNKDKNGNVRRVAGSKIQRVNAKWFNCVRTVENDVEYYTVPDEAIDYYKSFDSYYVYSLGFLEPNTTTSPKVRYGDKELNIVMYDTNKLEAGQLNGVYNVFSKNLLVDNTLYLLGLKSDIPSLIEITYADLVALRDAGNLVPGTLYRIIDYVTATMQADTKSAGHRFDIIVMALSTTELSENAGAIQHEGDTYFTNSKLEAWELKYCLDNDTNRFAWAKTSGKGVVYELVDEFENKCGYDFKNIQFRRYKITKCEKCPALVYGYYGAKQVTGSVLYPSDATISQTDTAWRYTFDFNGADGSLRGSGLAGEYGCYGNEIFPYFKTSSAYKTTRYLNNIVFLNTQSNIGCYRNTFGNNCHSNTFGNNCHSNTFGNGCYHNTFGNGCYSNTFSNDCYSNTFGNGCYHNTFGNGCYFNTFSNDCYSNTFGNNCYFNTFGNNCYFNTFGNSYCSNTFGNYCSYNTFGNNCYYNTFGNDGYSNTFGNNCYYKNLSMLSYQICYANFVEAPNMRPKNLLALSDAVDWEYGYIDCDIEESEDDEGFWRKFYFTTQFYNNSASDITITVHAILRDDVLGEEVAVEKQATIPAESMSDVLTFENWFVYGSSDDDYSLQFEYYVTYNINGIDYYIGTLSYGY